MKAYRPLIAAVFLLVVALAAWRFTRPREDRATASSPAASGAAEPSTAGETRRDGGKYPHAVHDPAKRDEVRRRILEAMAQAAASAQAERAAAEATGAPTTPPRGNRGTNDLEEFGRFVGQAIREDFIPMARSCAKELAARVPDAGGSVHIAFKLLGDTKIGGVVDEAHVDGEKSSLHDDGFETCVRESMYGVYFDPPPAGGEATLNFDVDVKGDGKGTIDDEVEDFHPRDRRNEAPAKSAP